MANFEKTIEINTVLKNSKTIEKLLELQKLKDEVDFVFRQQKSKDYDILEAIKNNEKLNLPKESVIGILLTIKL